MSKKEDRTLKIIISTLMMLAGVFIHMATETKVVSWWLISLGFLVLGVLLFVVFYRGRCLGLGKIAEEKDLDNDVSYRIGNIVNTSGRRLVFFDPSLEYETEIVMEPRDGFKKFEILEDKYLAPKKLKAKVVNGSLWTPVK